AIVSVTAIQRYSRRYCARADGRVRALVATCSRALPDLRRSSTRPCIPDRLPSRDGETQTPRATTIGPNNPELPTIHGRFGPDHTAFGRSSACVEVGK